MTDPSAADLDADVVVIGGGAVGSLVASLLHEARARVLVLEAGPRPPPEIDGAAAQPFAMPDEAPPDGAWRFRSEPEGARWLRARALGGRTRVWGGWCFRASEQNVVDAELAGVPWPLPLRSLDSYYARVERRLHVVGNRDGLDIVPDGECDGPVTLHPDLSALSAALDLPVIAGRIASVGQRPWRGTDALHGVDVLTETTVLHVAADDRGVLGVECLVGDGGRRFVRAPSVVLAASAIETARILSHHGGDRDGLMLTSALIASYMVLRDARAEAVPGVSRAALVPRFVNTPGGVARPYLGGFSVEVQGPHAASIVGASAASMLGLSEDALARMTLYLVSAFGSMLPSQDRTVRFDREDRDALGRPVPVLTLASTDNDRALGEEMKATCLAVAEALGGPSALVIPLAAPDGLSIGSEALHGARGQHLHDLDVDGHWRGAPGLYVADARHVPLVGDRHPTLTLLACAARTVDALLRDRSRGTLVT
ncbi:MAG: NAD(P)-binding protein [Polyangiales bacterium]